MYHSVWRWELFEIFSWLLTLQYGNLGGFSPGSSSNHGRTCGPRWTCFCYFKSWCTISWTSACVSVQVRYATPHCIDVVDSSSMSVSHETCCMSPWLPLLSSSLFLHHTFYRYTVTPKRSRLLIPVAHRVLDIYASMFGLSSTIRNLVYILTLILPSLIIYELVSNHKCQCCKSPWGSRICWLHLYTSLRSLLLVTKERLWIKRWTLFNNPLWCIERLGSHYYCALRNFLAF